MTAPAAPALQLGPQTFYDDFASLAFDTPKDMSHVWSPELGGFGSLGAHYLASNHEGEVYVDPSFAGVFMGDNAGNVLGAAIDTNGMPVTLPYGRPGSASNPPAWIQQGKTPLGLNPFSRSPTGGLRITSSLTPLNLLALLWGRTRISGELVTKPGAGNVGFVQQFGFFECQWRCDGGQGVWPAFWLLPASGAWPPEIDVFEGLGVDPTALYGTGHSNKYGQPNYRQIASRGQSWALSSRRSGVLWTPTDLVFFTDGIETGRIPAPADMAQPMYMLLDLAMGGKDPGGGQSWGGPIDATTPPVVNFDVDWVRVYALDPTFVLGPGPLNIGSAPPPQPPPAKRSMDVVGKMGSAVFAGTITEQ